MSAGPVVGMIWQGAHAVKLVRKITGGTEPLSSDAGTIRETTRLTPTNGR